MNLTIKRIDELTLELIRLLEQLDANKKITLKMYKNVLKGLPRVVLVDDDQLKDGAYIQGAAFLYLEKEFKLLSLKERAKRTIRFTFESDNWALIERKGKYSFECTWSRALEKIIDEIKKSSVFPALGEQKKKALELLTK